MIALTGEIYGLRSLGTLGGISLLAHQVGGGASVWLADEEAARKMAEEFVRDRVDLIAAFENQTIRAAKAATSEIPIVMIHADDPVTNGFVNSLAHPFYKVALGR